MEVDLPSVPIMKILSYVDAFTLLRVAQVNKSWKEVSERDFLWRKLCQKRWFCCGFIPELQRTETWKQFFLRRIRQERSMAQAKAEDFIYKEMSGDFGVQGYACYLSGSGLTMDGQGKSIVCAVTSMTRLTTWSIREGVMTWVSPVQPTCIMRMTTLPELNLSITVDMEATIKVWNCQDRDALATNTMFSSCQSLKAFFTKDGPVVMAGDTSGSIHTFRLPDLYLISRIHALEFDVSQLYCSPEKEWLFLSKRHPFVLPKVFFMDSILRPSGYSTPVCVVLSFTLCYRASWIPRRENRITLMYRRGPAKASGFTTYDLELEKTETRTTAVAHRVASFSLSRNIESPNWMGVSDKNVIVFSSGVYLYVFTMDGQQLQRFCEYPEQIMKLRVDPVRVIVTFMDGAFDVYLWEEESVYLKKCHHLQRASHLGPQSQIPKTLCDDVSIMRVVTRGPECFLLAYVLNIRS